MKYNYASLLNVYLINIISNQFEKHYDNTNSKYFMILPHLYPAITGYN